MNFYDYYAAQAKVYAFFPVDRTLEYTVIGLSGEIGELIEACYEYALAGSNSAHTMDAWEARRSEEGDAWWYLAAVLDAIDTRFGYLCELVALPEGPTERVTLDDIVVSFSKGLAAICGASKKAIRDNQGFLTEAHRDRMILGAMDIIYALKALSIDYKAIMTANLNKLERRQREGRMKNDGN